jgi:hypothetical protein
MGANELQISCKSVPLSADFVILSRGFAVKSCAFAEISCDIDRYRAKARHETKTSP